MSLIKTHQEAIIEEFSLLDGDLEMTLNYLIELGEELPKFPEDKRTENYIVKGCQSKVWLTSELEDNKVIFLGDSNTAITKGLLSLLIRIFSWSSPDEILNAELYFTDQIGMDRFIGTQRTNGYAAMVKQMKLDVFTLQQAKTTS